jgi:hypothetical protein
LQNGIQNGLRVIDVSNPSEARTVATLFDSVMAFQTGALSGNYVYSPEGIAGLAVYDISASGGPQFRSQLNSQNPGAFVAVAQAANATTLFAAGFNFSSGGVMIYDLQQQPPVQIGMFLTGSSQANDLALAANNLFVGTDQNLLTLDISRPSSPDQTGSLNIPINALSTAGGFLFAGTADGRLIVYNISTPTSPTAVASVGLPDKPIQLANSGNILLVADRTGGLLLFNVSVPSNPVLVAQVSVSPAVMGVQADGNLALLAALESGLVIVDFTNPSQPAIVSQTPLDSYDPFTSLSLISNRASSVAAANKIAFVGALNFDPSDLPNNGNGMVYGFDYSRSQHPRLVSLSAQSNVVAGGVTSLLTTGANLFVSGYNVGIIQLDAAQPRNTINLFYPPNALRPAPAPAPPLPAAVSSGGLTRMSSKVSAKRNPHW